MYNSYSSRKSLRYFIALLFNSLFLVYLIIHTNEQIIFLYKLRILTFPIISASFLTPFYHSKLLFSTIFLPEICYIILGLKHFLQYKCCKFLCNNTIFRVIIILEYELLCHIVVDKVSI